MVGQLAHDQEQTARLAVSMSGWVPRRDHVMLLRATQSGTTVSPSKKTTRPSCNADLGDYSWSRISSTPLSFMQSDVTHWLQYRLRTAWVSRDPKWRGKEWVCDKITSLSLLVVRGLPVVESSVTLSALSLVRWIEIKRDSQNSCSKTQHKFYIFGIAGVVLCLHFISDCNQFWSP